MVNLPAILIANGLGAALMLILIFSNKKSVRSVFFDEKLFFGMCVVTLFLCVTESLTFLLDGISFAGAEWVMRLLNSLLFIGNSFFSFSWTVYVDYKLFGRLDRLRRIYPFVFLPALLVICMAAANLFIDVFFTITPQLVYRRTPLAVVSYLVTYAYLMAGAVMVFRYRRKVGKYLFMPVVVFLAPVFIGSLLQMHFYGLALIWVSVALGITSLYINLQNEASLVDSLTKLYNRDYLTRFLSSAAQRPPQDQMLAGIMMDLNSFKAINDTYGHSEGDEALRAVGQILLRTVPRQGFAARYGGDEFIVITAIHTDKELSALVDAIRRATVHYNQAVQKPYQLSLSMGCAVFDPYLDDQDSFLRHMDERMYEEKRQRYSMAAHDRRRPRTPPSDS